MYINRDNYETIFLLYVDNELTTAEKAIVDEFVALNADLQQELVMLHQSVLKPDGIVFQDKNSLLRNEAVPTSLQEELLMYADKEMDEAGRIRLQELISTDADIKKEWELLQQTILSPDTALVFGDKSSLYRKEKGRVIAMPWRKIAAAAVLVGLGIWGTISYVNRQGINIDGGLAVKPVVKPTGTEKNSPVKLLPPSAPIKDEKTLAVKETVPTKTIEKNSILPSLNKKEKKIIVPEILTVASAQKDNPPPTVKNNNLPKAYFENLNNKDRNNNAVAVVTPEKTENNMVHPGNNVIVKENDEGEKLAAPEAIYTSFRNDENSNGSSFDEEEKTKKTKLGGFFRKVKRIIERNTNIKTGEKNFKVANLEFAIQ